MPGERDHRPNRDAAADVTSLSMRSPGRSQHPSGDGLVLKQPEVQYLPPEIERFRGALVSRDKAAALLAWGKTSSEHRHSYAGYNDLGTDLSLMIDVLGTQTIAIMGALQITFANRPGLAERVLSAPAGQWADAMTRAGNAMWQSFLANMPDRTKITDKQAKAWGRFVSAAQSKAGAKAAFERVFPTLTDTSYAPQRLTTVPWTADAIHRLYRTLIEHMPVAHVQMAGDFSLGSIYEGERLTYAFWQSSGNHIVIPSKDAPANKEDAKHPESLRGYRHFEYSALHEVGHAVGDHQGGHAWAETYAYTGWQKNLDVDAWSKNLWGDDAALTAAAQNKVRNGKPVLPAADARLFMAHDIRGHLHPIVAQGYVDDHAIRQACRDQYGDQPLTIYWDKARLKPKKAFRFPGTNNCANGRVWVYLTRGGMGYSSYKEQAFHDRVSWYSLSSYKEWFAENYEAYYKAEPNGRNNEPGTKAKLDALHAAKQRSAKDAEEKKPDAAGAPAPRRLPFPL